MMKLASLFDGISGFPLAAMHFGIEPVWASEIDPFPIAVAEYRFPNMQQVGDITQLDGAKLPPVDIITGGSPCQDLSVAGNREGLAGERSGLFMEQTRVTKEMRCADEQRGRTAEFIRPRFFVWENVPGAFSSANGEDFYSVLEEICRIKDSALSLPGPPAGKWEYAGAILGQEFSLAWRVLDAQYWGVPQRRKRVFVVADFGGHAAPQVLFEQDRLFGHPPQSSGAWQSPAATVGASSEGASGDSITPWDVQSRRLYDADGKWPALYGGEGGGRGYAFIGFDGYNGDLTGDQSATLGTNCGTSTGRNGVIDMSDSPAATAFACNQRDEVRDLHDISSCLSAQPGMKQQTYITQYLTPWDTQHNRIMTEEGVAPTLTGADGGGGRNPAGLLFSSGVVTKGNGDCFLTDECHTSLTAGGGQAGQGYPCVMTSGFIAGASPTAGNIGYQDECSPTLKAGSSGTSMVPSILCLNDQGGQRMDVSADLTGSLRAQEKGHQPLIFESHGQDSRYNQFDDVSPAVSAKYGTGGGNIPLTIEDESYCISGNIIDRQAHNGGNHFGLNQDVAYTLNTIDRHAVFSRQRHDKFTPPTGVTATQSARQGKDATDLVMDVAESENNSARIIRRLTPLECERLQGFPDGWTDIPGASDTSRYKALGNSVAMPCVVFIMRGIAYYLGKMKGDQFGILQ